ncbi:MAG: hypothetical protein DMG12_19645 [Acidobacteria bacterium]|nr:MAG: hypothetical protein DMG12_19645 [Acidobacteriota bacterium]
MNEVAVRKIRLGCRSHHGALRRGFGRPKRHQSENQPSRFSSENHPTCDAFQTQRYGNLATGARVTVQFREDNNQRVAAAVREMEAKSAGQPSKTKSRSKS